MKEEAAILVIGRPQGVVGGGHNGAEIDVERLRPIKENVPRMCILKCETVLCKLCLHIDDRKGRIAEHRRRPLERVGYERNLSVSNDQGRAIERQGGQLGVNEKSLINQLCHCALCEEPAIEGCSHIG